MSEAHSYLLKSLIEKAFHQLSYGDAGGAVDSLKEVLGIDPNHAYSHSLLALVLIDQKRLYAAEVEANQGLELEPESAFSHFAIAQVLLAKQKFKQALERFEHARALDPHDAQTVLRIGTTYEMMGQHQLALTEIQKAIELAPNNPEGHSDLGDWYLKRGDYFKAEEAFERALKIDAGYRDSLIGMGFVRLHQGKNGEARDHAIWVLQQNAMDHRALRLLSAIKAKESIWLGLWWRFNSWVTRGTSARIILILVGMYAFYRLSSIFLKYSQYSQYQDILSLIWLAFVVYTWVGPTVFHKSIKKELETVKLNPNF